MLLQAVALTATAVTIDIRLRLHMPSLIQALLALGLALANSPDGRLIKNGSSFG